MRWTAYATDTITISWRKLQSLGDAAADIARTQAHIAAYEQTRCSAELGAFLNAFASARGLAHEQGWDGTVEGDYRVFWLPNPANGDWLFAFAWKQIDGKTFVVSPMPLPWLEDAGRAAA
jgi:hypothetical protein